MEDVTQLLDAAASGDPRAAADLLPLVYDELRKLAAARIRTRSPRATWITAVGVGCCWVVLENRPWVVIRHS